MQHSDEYVQAVVESGERLPAAMCELGMTEEIMAEPVFDGKAVVDAQGE
ncbi:hypothetical protein [Castellaniella sp.]|nr:hypothetical protein [Castellaniella sp.]